MSLEDKFEKVYAELPAWLAETAISKCGVDRRDTIISKLIKYVIEPYVTKHKDDLVRGEKITINTDPLIEAAMRGWKELPIKPLSREEMKGALVGVAGSRMIAGMNVKISYIVKDKAKFMLIELVERPPPPPPPPPKVGSIEIWGINNIIIGMELFQKNKLGDNVKSIDMTIETENGCAFHITKASLDDLEWIIGENPIYTFINRISPISPQIRFAKLRIELLTPMEKEKMEEIITRLGISEGNFNLR